MHGELLIRHPEARAVLTGRDGTAPFAIALDRGKLTRGREGVGLLGRVNGSPVPGFPVRVSRPFFCGTMDWGRGSYGLPIRRARCPAYLFRPAFRRDRTCDLCLVRAYTSRTQAHSSLLNPYKSGKSTHRFRAELGLVGSYTRTKHGQFGAFMTLKYPLIQHGSVWGAEGMMRRATNARAVPGMSGGTRSPGARGWPGHRAWAAAWYAMPCSPSG